MDSKELKLATIHNSEFNHATIGISELRRLTTARNELLLLTDAMKKVYCDPRRNNRKLCHNSTCNTPMVAEHVLYATAKQHAASVVMIPYRWGRRNIDL